MFSFNTKRAKQKKRREVYLDYAASTPVDPDIVEIMTPYLSHYFYNPGALYDPAVSVKKDIEQARSRVAKVIGASDNEILFAGGATEANQMAIVGAVGAAKEAEIEKPEVMIAATEHPSIRNLCLELAKRNEITLIQIPVDEQGVVDLSFIREHLQLKTAMVSVHCVNNETGTIQPLRDIAKVLRRHRKQHQTIFPLLHSDAVQAAGCFGLAAIISTVDLATMSSQKIYGPKGVGFLYKARRVVLRGLFHGGGQEGGYRPGTENVSAIMGGTEALVIAQQNHEQNYSYASHLRGYCLEQLKKITTRIIVHQSTADLQSPHVLNFTIPGINGELLVIELAERGVYVAARAACSTNDEDASHVLASMYRDHPKKNLILRTGSVRVSFGKMTTRAEVVYFLEQIHAIAAKYL